MKRTLILLIFSVACSEKPDGIRQSPSQGAAPDAQSTIRELVGRLGARLKNVSLLGPADEVRDAIRREYEPLVTAELLQRWLADPATAPGRLTSSPWPERIEILETRPIGGRFEVHAEIVEATSADAVARRVPVAIEVVPVNGQWRISAWSTPDSSQPVGAGGPDAAAVIEAYYRAVNDRAYDRAYALWAEGGRASGQSLDQFRSRFAGTTRVTASVGSAGRIEGAAGSRYVKVPVTIASTQQNGESRRFAGTYVLRRSVVEGATEEQRSWRIASADLRRIPTLPPVDEAPRDPSFSAFRQDLLDIVRRKDAGALLAVVDPAIRTTFGSGGGRDDLERRWNASDPGSKLWSELEWVLSHGGSFRGEGANRIFWAPYIYSEWPESVDPFTHVAVVGSDIALRAEPRPRAGIVERLGHEMVRPFSDARDGWRQVETAAGHRGWIETRFLRSSIDYRAGFARRNGSWKMIVFVAGD
jgi:hypothetical protein